MTGWKARGWPLTRAAPFTRVGSKTTCTTGRGGIRGRTGALTGALSKTTSSRATGSFLTKTERFGAAFFTESPRPVSETS